jgi:hypothetical protein
MYIFTRAELLCTLCYETPCNCHYAKTKKDTQIRMFWRGHKMLMKSPSWFEFCLVNVKSTGRFRHIFLASSEYMNFIHKNKMQKHWHCKIATYISTLCNPLPASHLRPLLWNLWLLEDIFGPPFLLNVSLIVKRHEWKMMIFEFISKVGWALDTTAIWVAKFPREGCKIR